DRVDWPAVVFDLYREHGRSKTGRPDCARTPPHHDGAGGDFSRHQMFDESGRTLLHAHRRFMTYYAREPETPRQRNARFLQRRRCVDHRRQATLHVLRATTRDPVAVAAWRRAAPDGD